MAKEILLYSSFYYWTAEDFVTKMEEAKNQDVTVRINSSGGGVQDGWAMLAKFSEHTKRKLVKVDGHADSMALFFLAYADDVEASDVATFVLHRAAYPSYYESNTNYMTPDVWAELKRTNDKLRTALESKIDVAKFQQVTGYTLDQVFATPDRLEITLTAEQALQIGLINRVVQLTPEKRAELEGEFMRIAAQSSGFKKPAATQTNPTSQTTKTKNMTLAEFKANHPELYAQVIAEGVKKEKDRVEACLEFLDVDPKGVKDAIEAGTDLTQKQMAAFALKAFNPEALKKLQAESAKEVNTDEPEGEQSAEEKELEAFRKQVEAARGKK